MKKGNCNGIWQLLSTHTHFLILCVCVCVCHLVVNIKLNTKCTHFFHPYEIKRRLNKNSEGHIHSIGFTFKALPGQVEMNYSCQAHLVKTPNPLILIQWDLTSCQITTQLLLIFYDTKIIKS